MTILKRHPITDEVLRNAAKPGGKQRNRERLIDSITGSLRVEGYAADRETVAQVIAEHLRE